MKSILITFLLLPVILCSSIIATAQTAVNCPKVMDTPGVLLIRSTETGSVCEYDEEGNYLRSYSNTPRLTKELQYFLAIPTTSDDVVLKWETIKANNKYRFEILRSSDGYSFSKIGTVGDPDPNTGKNDFTFVDKYPLPGHNYYLIRKSVPGSKLLTSAIEKVYTTEGKPVVHTNSISASGDDLLLVYEVSKNDIYRLRVVDIDNSIIVDKEVHAFKGTNTYKIFAPIETKYFITFSNPLVTQEDIFLKTEDLSYSKKSTRNTKDK